MSSVEIWERVDDCSKVFNRLSTVFRFSVRFSDLKEFRILYILLSLIGVSVSWLKV